MDSTSKAEQLPRRSWGNWLLLAGSYVITTSGLIALVVLLPAQVRSPWPWVRTDHALVAACVFMVITLILHLSLEQRQADETNARFLQLQNELHESARRRLCALLSVSRIIGLQSGLQSVFDAITVACREGFACDQASLMLFDATRKCLVVCAASGHEELSKVLGSEQEIGTGVAGWVAKNKTPVILGQADVPDGHPEIKLMKKSLSSAIVVPIILRDELVGVINVSSRTAGAVYRLDDLHALEVFAENAGACIRHAEQAEWMRTTIATLRDQLESAGRASRPVESPVAK